MICSFFWLRSFLSDPYQLSLSFQSWSVEAYNTSFCWSQGLTLSSAGQVFSMTWYLRGFCQSPRVAIIRQVSPPGWVRVLLSGLVQLMSAPSLTHALTLSKSPSLEKWPLWQIIWFSCHELLYPYTLPSSWLIVVTSNNKIGMVWRQEVSGFEIEIL